MILHLFITLLAFSILSIGIGHATQRQILTLIGYGILFLCGTALIPGVSNALPGIGPGITYVNGTNNTVLYHYNETSPPTSDYVLTSTHETTTQQYTTYQNTTLGLYLALTGALGFILVGFDYKSFRDREHNRRL